MDKSTQFVVTRLLGGRQEMVSDVIYNDLSEAICAAVNLADDGMKPSHSSKKSISIGEGEYGSVKRVWMYYGAKYYQKIIFHIFPYEVYKSR